MNISFKNFKINLKASDKSENCLNIFLVLAFFFWTGSINNKEIKLNDKFKTLKDFYQENKSTYTEDEIKKIKEYIYKIIDGKIESRKEKSKV